MLPVVMGDSLAKGLVHQMARDYMDHITKEEQKLKRQAPFRSECRNTCYRRTIKAISGFLGSGVTRTLEKGEGKRRVWIAHAAMPNSNGSLVRVSYRVPFRDPGDFASQEYPIVASSHCVQRLIQIHGADDALMIRALWMAHSAALDRLVSIGDSAGADETLYTFSPTEMLIWKPSSLDKRGWVAVTSIAIDVLSGPHLVRYNKLMCGRPSQGVTLLVEEDYGVYLSSRVRLNLGMAMLDTREMRLTSFKAA